MATRSPSAGARFSDLYSEVETIGRGSFGEVLKVRRRDDDKEFVCKVLRYGTMKEKERQLVVSEVNILRGLRHPHIVRYHDRVIDKASAKLYIVMEYCQGGDLGQVIKRKRRERSWLEENRIWRALAQVLMAFEECHGHREGESVRPILHRDIKPCNIFLDSVGNVKVGDFGLAKELDACDKFATTNVGTPFYMSPELINEKRYNEKSDVWSIGCLVYEMCALRPPFEALNVVSLGQKITAGKFSRIPSRYSDELQAVVAQMLTLNPNKRPSVQQLLKHPRIIRYLPRQVTEQVEYAKQPEAEKTETDKETLRQEQEEQRRQEKKRESEESLAKKMAELQARESELERRERALELRERDVVFREKLVAKYERELESRPGIAVTLSEGNRRASLGSATSSRHVQPPPLPETPPAVTLTRRSSDRFDSERVRESDALYAKERRVFGRAQSVDEILQAAKFAQATKRRAFDIPTSDSSDIENISPVGTARTLRANKLGSGASSGSSTSASSKDYQVDLAGKVPQRASTDSDTSWLRRNPRLATKDYSGLTARLPRPSSKLLR